MIDNDRMQKRLPFPTEILDIPQVTRLKPAPFGILMRLLLDYWNTGLAIPKLDYERVAMANGDLGTIQRHKLIIEECLALAVPVLEATYVITWKKLNKRRYLAANARKSIDFDKKRLSQLAVSNLYDAVSEHVEISPVNSPGILQNTGKFDPVARQKAKASLKAPKATLTDE